MGIDIGFGVFGSDLYGYALPISLVTFSVLDLQDS